MKSILSITLLYLIYISKTFETLIWNGKQNSLTGPVITGSFEKRAPGERGTLVRGLPRHSHLSSLSGSLFIRRVNKTARVTRVGGLSNLRARVTLVGGLTFSLQNTPGKDRSFDVGCSYHCEAESPTPGNFVI